MIVFHLFFFFFQAEDGIRDYKVTGVQTCALPIYSALKELDPYGEVGFALVEFLQCAVKIESFTQSSHLGQFRPLISSFRLLPKTDSDSLREAFGTDL